MPKSPPRRREEPLFSREGAEEERLGEGRGVSRGICIAPPLPRRPARLFLGVSAGCLFQTLPRPSCGGSVNAGAFGTPAVIFEEGLEGWLVSSRKGLSTDECHLFRIFF